MRRPALTRAQRAHAKEQRALLALRRAAARYSFSGDQTNADEVALAFADLTAACDRYRLAIGERAARRLVRPAR